VSAAVVELLRAGRERIARGLAAGAYARDGEGREVFSWSPEACSWCSHGSLRFAPNFSDDTYKAAVEALEAQTPGRLGLVRYSDEATQADVLALFDRAIAAAEAQS